jgi:stage V sporulation protein B
MEEETVVMKGGAFNIVGRLGRALLGFVLTIFLARYLGPHGFGLLSIGLAIITIFYVTSDLGMSLSMLFHIPKYIGSGEDDKAKGVYEFTKKVVLILATISSVSLFLLSDFISVHIYHTAELIPLLKIFSLALFFQTFFTFYKVTFQSFRNMKYYMLVDLVLGTTKFIALALVVLGFGVFGAFLGFTASHFIVLVFCMLAVLSGKIAMSKRVGDINRKSTVKMASWFFSLGFLGLFFGSLTNMFIGYLLDPTNVAYFSISVTISSIILMIPQSLGDSLQPFISENLNRKSKIGLPTKRIMKYSILISIPTAGGSILLRESILRFLYGAPYVGASSVMVPVILGAGIMGSFWMFIPLVYGTGKVRIEVESSIMKAIINVALCFLLIPILGVAGAGIAQLVMIAFGFSYVGLKIRKHVSLEIPWRTLFKAIIASGVMLLTLSSIQWVWEGWLKLVILGIVGSAIYSVMIYLMKDLDETDIRFIKGLIRRLYPR